MSYRVIVWLGLFIAGIVGISVILFDRKKEYMIPQIERKAGVRFERVTAPQPIDIAKAGGSTATDGVRAVSDKWVQFSCCFISSVLKACYSSSMYYEFGIINL